MKNKDKFHSTLENNEKGNNSKWLERFGITQQLHDYFKQEKEFYYHPTEVDVLFDKYEYTDHPGAKIINDLLLSVNTFLLEINSRWNKIRSEAEILDIFNAMATAIHEFENAYPKIALNADDDASSFISALNYTKQYILRHLEEIKNEEIYTVYNKHGNQLKKLLGKKND